MTDTPELFWISGSPPSWRVMLALTLKRASFKSCLLDHAAGENRRPGYLAINPKGQVPTLRHGTRVIRESLAIVAYCDRAWPEVPVFGPTAAEAAIIWQDVALFEADLIPAAKVIAQHLLRGQSPLDEGFATAVDRYLSELDRVAVGLEEQNFVSSPAPSASDIWLYPTVNWIARAIEKARDDLPARLINHLSDRAALETWHMRFAALPGVDRTHPPHWIEKERTTE